MQMKTYKIVLFIHKFSFTNVILSFLHIFFIPENMEIIVQCLSFQTPHYFMQGT